VLRTGRCAPVVDRYAASLFGCFGCWVLRAGCRELVVDY
ncbi:unnamed protein product, partial [Oikopleura dioica]